MSKLHEIPKMMKQHRGTDSTRAAATQSGISYATISRVERGHIPDIETFGKICKWLKISPAYFLEYDETNGAKPAAAQLQLRIALAKVKELSSIIQTAENVLAD